MFKVNQDYLKLPGSYLFSTVARKQREYQAAHPEAEIIKLSIGDVTQPLAPAIVEAPSCHNICIYINRIYWITYSDLAVL